MAVVDAVAVSVGHHAPALGRALRLVESQDGDLGEFGAGATAAVRAAPAQDFLALVLKRLERVKCLTGKTGFSDNRHLIPHAGFESDTKSEGKQCFGPHCIHLSANSYSMNFN